MTYLTDLTVREALAGLRSKAFSSRELIEACLTRIDSLDPALHAFLTLTPDRARAGADAADKALRSDAPDLAPLTGLPLAIKDVLCLKGERCTCGSKILENFIPPFTATTVQRLLDAGVIPLGKTQHR